MRSPQRDTKPKTVLIVDDHPLIVEGIRSTLNNHEDLSVCAAAHDVKSGWRLIGDLQPDIALVDLVLPGVGGLELVKTIATAGLKTRSLVISMHDESVYAERCLRAGARGYWMKGGTTQSLVNAIRTVCSGRMVASQDLQQNVLERLLTNRRELSDDLAQLTEREFQIFTSVAEGKTGRQIASELSISPKTVDVHRIRIRKKLNVSSNSELVRFAVEWQRDHAGTPQY